MFDGMMFVGETLQDEMPNVLRFRLERAKPLHGRILVRPGVPAVGLPVIVRGECQIKLGPLSRRPFHCDYLYARTDTEGRFSFGRLPIAAAELEIPLRPLARYAGRVVSARGTPVAGAGLGVCRGGGSAGWEPYYSLIMLINHSLLRGTTDADGRFSLPFLPRPDQYQFVSVSHGDASASVKVAVDTRDATIEIKE